MVLFVIFSIFDKEGVFPPPHAGGKEGGNMVLAKLVTIPPTCVLRAPR